MKFLFVFHDPPYGTERAYNGLRWARQLLTGGGDNEVRVFLFGDAVVCAQAGQKTPNGFYNIGRMLQDFCEKGGSAGSCGSCLDARGVREDNLLKGVHRSSLKELCEWTEWADQIVNV
ncbi:DsrE/DsrF/TusD sulfur relay family protein [Actinomadura welshii]